MKPHDHQAKTTKKYKRPEQYETKYTKPIGQTLGPIHPKARLSRTHKSLGTAPLLEGKETGTMQAGRRGRRTSAVVEASKSHEETQTGSEVGCGGGRRGPAERREEALTKTTAAGGGSSEMPAGVGCNRATGREPREETGGVDPTTRSTREGDRGEITIFRSDRTRRWTQEIVQYQGAGPPGLLLHR